MYCLVVTNDYSRFTWVFFLGTKDETSGILKSFITMIENLVDHKVKVIRCDNGTEFKNREMNQFCKIKGIMRQFSVARTPQQNGVVERRNMTLIEATRTMLADSKLLTTFWAEAVNTACYVQNIVLVVKPHNKTPYELFHDHLGKFDGKADEGFFVGYCLNSKAFRVFNSRTRIMEEKLHIRFSDNTPNIVGSGLDWLFDIDALTRTMNYEPIIVGTQSNGFADPKSSHDDGFIPSSDDGKKVDEDPSKGSECNDQEKENNVNITNNVNTVSTTVNAPGANKDNELLFDPNMPALEDVGIFNFSNKDEYDDIVADMNNKDTTIQVSPTPTTRIHKDHPLDQVIGDLHSATQTRYMTKNLKEDRSQLDRGYAGSASTIQVTRIARIEAIRLFLAYASFKDFVVYQMDVKSVFLYGKIKEEVYVCQPQGFEDPEFLDRVYKVKKALYRLHQAPRAWFTEVKNASTPIETQNPLLKDQDGEEVDVHIYQVNLKVSHLHTVKRIFKYLKGHPKLGLWVDGMEIIITESSVKIDLQLTDEDGVDCLPNSTIFNDIELMRKPKRKNTQVPQPSGSKEYVADEAVYKELDDRLVRDATIAFSLEVEQDS
nr:hypothetical protein [Tanacetum cinerariifolium]